MNIIVVESKRKKLENIVKRYPTNEFEIIDVTSKAEQPWVRFSPFFPIENIPVPFSEDVFSASVEGIWQGLKVFEEYGIDTSKFHVSNMKNIKRTVRKYGTVVGHQKGTKNTQTLNYSDAKREIYLPSYKWVLDNRLQDQLNELKEILSTKSIVLLDYETNTEVFNHKPLSHAFLIKLYLENKFPVK